MGLAGTHHARFINFVYSLRTILGFLKDSASMRARRYVGHNPAGGAMVILLIAMISGIVTTDTWWGIEWVEDVHKRLVYSTLGLIVLHVAGVVLASPEHRENLVRAMITGWKRR
jgi:cytochrome b